jgi:amino acid transporter
MLERRITFVNGVAIAIAMVVGSGLFGLPGLVIESVGHVVAFMGWVTVAIVLAPLIHVFATLGMRHPEASGVAGFASLALGPWSRPGFLLIACGALAVGMPAFFLVGGAYLAELLQLDVAKWRGPFAILLAAASTLMNLLGVRNLGSVNRAIVVLVLAFIVGTVAVILPQLGSESRALWQALRSTQPSSIELWLAASIVFWAFQGWENMSFGLEEFKDPKRTIPLVYWVSFAIVTAIYLLFAWVVSAVHYGGVEVLGISGISALIGQGWWRPIILAVMVVILFANANSWVYGASRAFYSAAGDGVLPRFLKRVDSAATPRAALLAALAFYVVVILAIERFAIHERYAFLLTTQGFIILYGMSVLAYLRAEPGRPTVWVIAALSLIGWGFLLTGFSWLIAVPATLFTAGVLITLARRKASGTPLAPAPVSGAAGVVPRKR